LTFYNFDIFTGNTLLKEKMPIVYLDIECFAEFKRIHIASHYEAKSTKEEILLGKFNSLEEPENEDDSPKIQLSDKEIKEILQDDFNNLGIEFVVADFLELLVGQSYETRGEVKEEPMMG